MMRHWIRALPGVLLLLVVSLSSVHAQDDVPNGCVVTAPPAALQLDPFYAKYCEVNGIPILSSASVPDAALQRAWDIADHLLQDKPELSAKLVENHIKIGIIGANEVITDLPDYRQLDELYPETDWDTRTRGVGATATIPMTSGAEENLLCYQRDNYRGEDIFVHEFSHTVKQMAIQYVDATFQAKVADAYQSAMNQGLWKDTYATTDPEEYWAEGVQDYFNVNLEVDPPNGIHNFVNTRAELDDYDPTLFALIDGLYSTLDWQPACPPAPDNEPTPAGPACSMGGQAADLVFKNQMSAAVSVYWIDYQCSEVLYKTLAPGESFTQPTYIGHIWAVRSASGNLLGRTIAQSDHLTITIPEIACTGTDPTPTSIDFDNQTSAAIDIFWVNYDCQEVLYQTLQPGQSYTQPTYASHNWVMRGADGTLVGQYAAAAEPMTVTLK